MLAAIIKARTGLTYVEIPYQGESQLVTGMLGGNSDISMVSLATSGAMIRSGKLRPLWVMMTKRSSLLPDVPSLPEVGIRENLQFSMMGLWAPLNTPGTIIQKVATEAAAAIQTPEVREKVAPLGLEVSGTTPAEQMKAYEEIMAGLQEAVRIVGYKPQ